MRKIEFLAAQIALFLPLLALIAGCVPGQKETIPSQPDRPAAELSGEQGKKSGDADKSSRAEEHLRLARLYSSHKNPDRNYQLALKELELYISLNPAGAESDEIQDWLAVLREVSRNTEELKKSRSKINQLGKENKDLKDSVEKLKNLDIRMEEKRKQAK